MGKLTTNGDERVNAIGPGKTEIHQGDVWPVTAEFFQSLRTIARLRNQQHVGLGGNNRVQAFAENRMVLNAQNANRLRGSHRNCPLLRRQLYWIYRPELESLLSPDFAI